MAVIHTAYVLDFIALEIKIADICTAGVLQPHALAELARQGARCRQNVAQEFLMDIRFDDDWLEVTDSPFEKVDYWFKASLALYLLTSRNLSSESFANLEVSLPLLDWSNDDLTALLVGYRFARLAASLNCPSLEQNIHKVDLSLGWLSASAIARLLGLLRESRDELTNPAEHVTGAVIDRYRSIRQLERLAASDLLRQAYAEAEARLSSAHSPQHQLLFVNDILSYRPHKRRMPL